MLRQIAAARQIGVVKVEYAGMPVMRHIAAKGVLMMALAALAACDGDPVGGGLTDAGPPPAGREPATTGAPLPVCTHAADCAEGTSCVFARPGHGHCHPNGGG